MNARLTSREAIRKAAILVTALDAASADALLDKMHPAQAQRVRDAVMELEDIDPQEEEAVLSEFLRAGGRGTPAAIDEGVELEVSLVGRMAEPDLPPPAEPATPFRSLMQAPPGSLVRHLRGEHPQVIAVVLAHLPAERAAAVLQQLSAELQTAVLRRVAELDQTDAAVLQELEEHFQALLSDEIRLARTRHQGLAAVASILAAAGEGQQQLWENLRQHDDEFAGMLGPQPQAAPPRAVATTATRPVPPSPPPSLPSRMRSAQSQPAPGGPRRVVPARRQAADAATREPEDGRRPPRHWNFQKLAQLTDFELTAVFAETPAEFVLVALAGAGPDWIDRLCRQLSRRDGRALRRGLRQQGPLRLSDIERAQEQVVLTAWQMHQARKLRLRLDPTVSSTATDVASHAAVARKEARWAA